MARLGRPYWDSLASFESPNRASQLSQALASRLPVLVTVRSRAEQPWPQSRLPVLVSAVPPAPPRLSAPPPPGPPDTSTPVLIEVNGAEHEHEGGLEVADEEVLGAGTKERDASARGAWRQPWTGRCPRGPARPHAGRRARAW